MAWTAANIAERVGGRLFGDPNHTFEDVAPLDRADERHVTFLEADKHLPRLQASRAGLVLCSAEVHHKLGDHPRIRIVVDDPQGAFIAAMLLFRPRPDRESIGVSPAAHVSPTARIGAGTNVFPGASIGDDAEIGANCDIHPGAVVGARCRIGEGTTLHPHAVLYPDVSIGSRVILHAGAVIGADGFGYRFVQGRFVHIPHTGTVRIEDDVEIGAGTAVDRAMIGATVVGEGTKLDNHVMIAHNCELGKHNAFASQVGLAGSVVTGDYVRAAGQVGVADHAVIGRGCTLGPKAAIRGRVPDGETWHGFPAGPEREQMRLHMTLQKVPEMREQVRDLLRQVAALQKELAALTGSGSESAAAA